MRYKEIKNYPGYKIDALGDIISLKKGKEKVLKQSFHRQGYRRVWLSKDGKRSPSLLVHRLVAEAFLPNPKNKPCVCHKNDVPDDNRVENLFWGTMKENIQDAVKKGRMKFTPFKKGEKNPVAKLTTEKVKEIRRLYSLGFRKSQLAYLFEVSISTISPIIENLTWKHI